MFEKEAEEAGNEKIKGNYQFARCARKSYNDFEFHIANNPKFRIVCVIGWKEIELPKE